MATLKNSNLKLAIQKDGRLTEETVQLLHNAGLDFDSYKRKLFSTCHNFPLEILFVRDDDIPNYVATGTVDLGIVGENIVKEYTTPIPTISELDFGYCNIALAVLKESSIKTPLQLKNKVIATSYPHITKHYFDKKNIPVKVVTISGSVEITPTLGIASAIVDIVSTGSTLALNDLRIVDNVTTSRAVLIGNKKNLQSKQRVLEHLLTRFEGVQSAKDYKYIMMNAPKDILPEVQKLLPGLKSPTVANLANSDWISIQTVIKEDIFWETIEKLKKIGASGILVLPIEKMIR